MVGRIGRAHDWPRQEFTLQNCWKSYDVVERARGSATRHRKHLK